MIELSYRDGRPLYEQVKDSLRQLMISGVLCEGERLPSVRELAMELTINPNTVQRAYRELEQEGYIVSVPGKGSFVDKRSDATEARRRELKDKIALLVEELRSLNVGEDELKKLLGIYGGSSAEGSKGRLEYDPD